jgi:hypothetical protein
MALLVLLVAGLLSPTSTMAALAGPSPKTVCVARS